jgi:MFS superfamily sulfate permease-like transporter
MKHARFDGIPIKGMIKDLFISLMFFTVLLFVDFKLAFFVSVVCMTMLISRRMVLELNPGFIKGHKIYYKNKKLRVPAGVDIFDLDTVLSIDYLLKYVEVIRNIINPPKILIIRFNNILRIDESETEILFQAVQLLERHKISIIFSEVNATVQHQFRQNGISERVKENNIFFYITDAVEHATGVLKNRINLLFL